VNGGVKHNASGSLPVLVDASAPGPVGTSVPAVDMSSAPGDTGLDGRDTHGDTAHDAPADNPTPTAR
jgi:hypothetical protein